MKEVISADVRKWLDLIPGGVGVFRVSTRVEVIFANKALVEMSQRTAEEFASWVRSGIDNVMIPEDAKALWKEVERAVQTKGKISMNVRLANTDEEEFWVKVVGDYYGQDEAGHIFIGTFVDISKEKMLEEKLIHRHDNLKEQLKRDKLTGLYNREEMMRYVDWYFENRQQKDAVFLMIDIDNFKGINDTYGHIYGDETLEVIAARLKELFRKSDKIGRVGGDEFIVFIPEGMEREAALEKAKNVCRELDMVVEGEETTRNISCSVGVALAPEHGMDFKTLYCSGDSAQYEAKRSGKNRAQMYDTQQEQREEPNQAADIKDRQE